MRVETLQPIRKADGTIEYVSPSGNTYRGLGGITADSQPDYDDWGWDSYWGCNEWVEWHKALVKKYGLEAANVKFKLAWDKQDQFEHAITTCRYNSQVVEYFMSQGIDIRSFVSAILLPIIKGTVNVTENVVNTAENVSSGAFSTSKVLKNAVPLLLLGVLGFAGYYGYQVATGKKSLEIGPVKLGKKK